MIILITGLAVACITDYMSRRIPNILLAAIAAAGMTECYFTGGFLNLAGFILKTVFVVMLFYPVFKIGAMGAGDVKLIGISSGFFNVDDILYFLFFSMLTAAIFSIIKMCVKRNFKERFLNLLRYASETARKGRFEIYFKSRKEMCDAGLCMSGPMLCSILLHVGGIW